MANIATYLQKIMEAIYGEEVRGSIHDALDAMNTESSNAMSFAQTAKDSAANSAKEAKVSEDAAGQKATEAEKYAAAALKSEQSAKSSESTASQKATDASASASEANDSKNAAQASADTALKAQAAAEDARGKANQSKEAAEAALEKAEAAKDKAVESSTSAAQSAETAKQYSGNPPRISDHGTWEIWDAENQVYEDTGKKSLNTWDKTYESVAAMEEDKANQPETTVAIISSDTEQADNAKVYIKGSDGDWHFLCDLSGLQGIGIEKITLKEGGHAPGTSDVYTIKLTDGTEYDISVYNGRNGEGAGDVLGIYFDLIIPQNSWAEGQATIADEHLLALSTFKYFVDSESSCKDEYEECHVRAKDIEQSGYITFLNDTDPKKDLTVNVLRLELSANS